VSVTVKYNHDLGFRRRVAFYRMYRAKDFQKRFKIEMIALAVTVLASVLLWFLGGDAPYVLYVFYFTVVMALSLLVRVLRALMVAWRVKDGDGPRMERAFAFDARGFSFGPLDEAGKTIETRWRDVDRVYLTKGAVYILAMGRRHWAAVDRRLMAEGTWDELLALIRENLPKRQIVQ
jgi:hypothetical protein